MRDSKALRKLRAHPKVDDVEDAGMDEGRFFVHLKPEWDFDIDPWCTRHSESFGNMREALHAVNHAIPANGKPWDK